jgi:hypothetical protein
MSPRNRMAQLYPQALGFLSEAPYGSQDYVGGIQLRIQLVLVIYIIGTDRTENISSCSCFVVV